jgi:hypothetical protein
LAKIILKNSAKIDLEEKYIEEFCSFANLPKGKIFLVLHGNSLPESNQGVCVSSQLIKFAPELLGICPCSNLTTWDCCIAIAKKWCICRDVFPAYFTYLLGHEFGHAYVCLSDIALHIHCCLIRDWIRPASKNVIQLPHSLPNEQLFDRFGKYLSFKMHGDEKLDLEINALKETAGDIEKQHLEMIQELSPSGKFDGLRNSIIEYSRPYRDELIRCWKKDFEENGSNSLASLISDYDELFEY